MGKLFSLGHKIIHIPTLKILKNDTNPIDAKQFDAFIFTSANAVRNLKVMNKNQSKLCFCVGSITEKIARQQGFSNTISAGGTVNALKNLIIHSNKINDSSKLAYFCGDNTSYDLEGELKREGFKVASIDLGGGVGIKYNDKNKILDIKSYAQVIDELFSDLDLEIIQKRTDLGLQIDSAIGVEFEKKTKHINFAFLNGIDFIHQFFNFERKTGNNFLSKSVQYLGKNNSLNKFFTKVADEGIFI